MCWALGLLLLQVRHPVIRAGGFSLCLFSDEGRETLEVQAAFGWGLWVSRACTFPPTPVFVPVVFYLASRSGEDCVGSFGERSPGESWQGHLTRLGRLRQVSLRPQSRKGVHRAFQAEGTACVKAQRQGNPDWWLGLNSEREAGPSVTS